MNTERMSVGGPLEKRPRAGRWLWRMVGLCLQLATIALTLTAMAGAAESKWSSFFMGVALAGGFMLWKEAEKVGKPKPLCITQDDIDADADVAEAVDVITEYVNRRGANAGDHARR